MNDEIKLILDEFREKIHKGIPVDENLKETVTIRKSDVEKLGSDLMKEIDEFLHNDYILTFPELKLDQEKFDNLKEKVTNLNVENIHYILSRIKLDEEIDGDLYYKKESFKDLFKVLSSSYSYLED